jgi:hypothetical protein
VAVIVGLAAGVFASFPFVLGIFNVYSGLQHVLPLPPKPSAGQIVPFMLGLYAIWFLVILTITRRVGKLNSIHLFLFVLPLPSILISYLWQSSLD